MTLPPGTQLGDYEIVCLIGEGGMGEVYRAKDPKLGRVVAIKVLPASLAKDGELLCRFEREAKAVAALSHPNVLGIFDFATKDDITFAVMELLEGESLRDKLRQGALPVKRAIEIATELANGLGAAHAQGIIHRDVKPENIFLTKDGRVKVLDFGLAKQIAIPHATHPEQATATPEDSEQSTRAGMILGTVGYMSPEQVRGEPADHRADVFAFGVVLHEILTGQRPFKGETPLHTMTAILDQDPPELTGCRGLLPPALERMVAHCLEKRPEARFQSMKDIAFGLQNLSTMTNVGPDKTRTLGNRHRAFLLMSAGAAVILLAGFLEWILCWPPFSPKPLATFGRLTFAPGTVEGACFGPDGKTIYFSQRIQGGKPEIFVIHPNATEAKPLGVRDALLLGVSASSELAILRNPEPWYTDRSIGTLAQVSGEGGAIKEIQEHVIGAAWDGQAMAVLSTDENLSQLRLEFPVGKTLIQADPSARTIKLMRISRDGTRLALVDTDLNPVSEIAIYDRDGRRQVVFQAPGDSQGDTLTGLAWGKNGELWCSQLQGEQTAVWSIRPGKTPRPHWRGPGAYELMDVSPEGRLLLAQQHVRRGVLVQKAGDVQPKEVSVLGGTQAWGLSDDGRTLLLMESPVTDGGTPQDLTYVRKLDGSPAIRLSRGTPRTLSPDGRWVQLLTDGLTPEALDPGVGAAYQQVGLDPKVVLNPSDPKANLLLLPTGPGRPQVVALPSRFNIADLVLFLPDNQHLVFVGGEKGHSTRWYLVPRKGGEPKPLTPEGYCILTGGLNPLAPDGTRFLVSNGKNYFIQSIHGGEPQIIKGLRAGETPIRWASDGNSIFLQNRNDTLTGQVVRFAVTTGARHPVLSFSLPDPAGFQMFRSIYMTPDAKTFTFTYCRKLSELYVVDGAK